MDIKQLGEVQTGSSKSASHSDAQPPMAYARPRFATAMTACKP